MYKLQQQQYCDEWINFWQKTEVSLQRLWLLSNFENNPTLYRRSKKRNSPLLQRKIKLTWGKKNIWSFYTECFSLVKKKASQLDLFLIHLLPPMPEMLLNLTKCGHLCKAKRKEYGFGLLFAVGQSKSWHIILEIGIKNHLKNSTTMFL